MVEFNRGSWMAVKQKQKHLVKKYVYVSITITVRKITAGLMGYYR